MKPHSVWIFFALILLTAVTANAAEVDWQVMRTSNFIIYHAPGAESVGQRAGEIAEEWHAKLSERLDFQPKGTIPMYLYPDRTSFAKDIGIDPADRIVGIAHTRTHRVRVDASGGFTDIQHIIPHELVHVFVSLRLRGYSPEIPLWMHEGLAKYFADDWSIQDAQLLAEVASGGELHPLEKISRAFPADPRQRSIAYVQSYSAIKYMIDKYTLQCIPDLFEELETGLPFETALFYSIGSSPEEFESAWREFLWEEHALNRIFKFISGIVYGLMGFLAILAFRARLRYKRRKAREMEEQEEEERFSDWDSIMRGNPPF